MLLCLLVGCEDVIEVETPSREPRLIVEAVLRVNPDEETFPVRVKVSETSNFFEEIPVTELELIQIWVNNYRERGHWLSTYYFGLGESEPGSGVYTTELPSSIVETEYPSLYELHINHKGRTYFAFGEYAAGARIDRLELGDRTLFDEDETEVVVHFTDDPEYKNYYVFDFGFGNYLASEDMFYQGQEFYFSYFYDQTFPSGTELEVSLLGATEEFYNYMDLLIEQSESNQGPFQTPVATVRGNIFDITGLDNINIKDNVGRPDDFPLGFFAIVQEHTVTITIP